jgi:tetratricopeptide (TPR) repeat protein
VAQNKLGEAEKLIREALDAHRQSGSTVYQKIGYLQTMLATVLMKQAKFAEAEELLRQTLDLFARNLPPDHQYIASTEHYLGEALLATGKLAEAEQVLTAAMNRWQRTGAATWRSARSANALGEVLHRQGRNQEAETHLVQSYRELIADPAAEADSQRLARERITKFYVATGQRQKLDALLREGGDKLRTGAVATQAPGA